MASITLLGTAGDEQLLTSLRRRAGGIIVKLDGNQFHIDPGVSALDMLRHTNVHVRETVGLLVSQNTMHTSHDINLLLAAMSHSGLDPHGVMLAADSVLNGTDEQPAAILPGYEKYVERAISMKSVPRVSVNHVTILAKPMKSKDPTAVGFQLVGDHETISYTGHTGWFDDLPEAHAGASTLIACLGTTDDGDNTYALRPHDIIELTKAVQPRTLVLTGFSNELHKLDVKNIGRAIHRKVPCTVVVGEDGFTMDTLTYR